MAADGAGHAKTADYMGLTIGHTTSAAEEIAKAIPVPRW